MYNRIISWDVSNFNVVLYTALQLYHITLYYTSMIKYRIFNYKKLQKRMRKFKILHSIIIVLLSLKN